MMQGTEATPSLPERKGTEATPSLPQSDGCVDERHSFNCFHYTMIITRTLGGFVDLVFMVAGVVYFLPPCWL